MIDERGKALSGNRKKKREGRTFAEWLAIDGDIPAELFAGGSFIELHGRNSVVVRGCKRILTYSESRVALKMRREIVEVTGKRLTCVSYLAGAVSVEGLVDSVSFLRREDEK